MSEKPSYEALEQKIASLEARIQQVEHLDLFFQNSSDGFFFMMLDKPVHWNENTDKETTLDYIFAHHRITRFNEAILRQNAMSAEAYQGLTPNDIYKDNIALGRKLWAEFLDRGYWELEQEIFALNIKKPLIIKCTYEAIYDEKGRFYGHFGVHRDITEQKQNEEKTRLNEAKYRTLFEDSPEGVLLFNPETWKPFEFNDKVLDMLGYERDKFSQMSLEQYLVDYPQREQIDEVAKQIKEHGVLEMEVRMYRLDKQICIIQVTIKYIQIANQGMFFNIWTDITEKKKAEEQLHLTEERFRSAIDSSLDAFYILEAFYNDEGEIVDFTFVDMNLVGKKQLDFLGVDVIGQQLCEIHPINREQGFFDRYKQVFLSGKTLDDEFEIVVEGYDPQWLHHTVVKLANGVAITARDITLRKTATESIRLSEERFRSAIDSSLDVFYILDAYYDNGKVTDFTIVDMNKVGIEAIKLSKEEILGKQLCDILPMSHTQGFFKKYKEVFLTGNTLDEEVYIAHEKLMFSWTHHTIVKLKDGIAITARNITLRKQNEEKLSLVNEKLLQQQRQTQALLKEITNREQKFRSLAENIKDVFWITKNNNIEYVSPAYEVIWQQSIENLYNNINSFREAIHPEDRPRIEEVLAGEKYNSTGLFSEEYRVLRPDKSIRWISARTFPVEINEHTFHIVGIAKDITERKATEVTLASQNRELSAQDEELRLANEELQANKETLEDALEKLSRSESSLQALFDSSEQAIVLLDTQFQVVAFNKTVTEFHENTIKTPLKVGKSIFDYYFDNPHLKIEYRNKFEQCLQGKVIVFERQLNYPDLANIRWVETSLFPVRNHYNQIVGLSLNEKDVTGQRHIALKLRKSEVRLRGLMNNTVQAFFLLDKNRRLLLYNTSAIEYTQKAFGTTLKMGVDFLEFTPKALAEPFKEKFEKALRGERSSNEREMVFADGSKCWFDVTYAPIKNTRGESDMVVFSTLDITQRKSAQVREKELLHAQITYQLEEERLKRTAIIEGQEKESHRISRELHDSVGQMLSALSYQINDLETILKDNRNKAASEAYYEKIDATTERAKNLLKEVIQEVREISHNLMPKILTDYGLIEALKQLRLDFASGINIPINLDIFCETQRFDDNIEISIFRITQEAVNNVLKYANASEINIQLIEHATNLQLLVEDNGVGFTLAQAKMKDGNGLINMEERAKLVGGSLSVDTELNKGTCIMVEIPLKNFGNE